MQVLLCCVHVCPCAAQLCSGSNQAAKAATGRFTFWCPWHQAFTLQHVSSRVLFSVDTLSGNRRICLRSTSDEPKNARWRLNPAKPGKNRTRVAGRYLLPACLALVVQFFLLNGSLLRPFVPSALRSVDPLIGSWTRPFDLSIRFFSSWR